MVNFGNQLSGARKKDPLLFYRELLVKTEGYLNSGNSAGAERHARDLQRKFPQDAKANMVLAQALVAKNELRLAIPFAENAVRLAPFHPGTNYFLGRLYLSFDLYEKAAPLFEESLRKAPGSALILWAFADMYMAMNDGEKAADYYERALALQLDVQQRQQIKQLYAECLSSIDRHQDALRLLSEFRDLPGMQAVYLLEQSKNPKPDQPNLAHDIEKALLESATEAEKAALYHAQGNLLDQGKQHEAAFEKWQFARALTKDTFPIDAYVGTVDNLIALYSKAALQQLSPHGDPSQVPVFVFGMARSGTTLVEQIIAAHKDAAGVSELSRMGNLEHSYFNKYSDDRDSQKIFRNARNGELLPNAKEYLNLLDKILPDNPQRIVDKGLNQYQSAGFIHACFPKARFVHCIRHPADSFVSAIQNRLQHPYVSDQVHYAKFFLGKEKLMAHWRTCFPEQIFDLEYERLVQDPEPIVRQLIAFLGLDWDPNCMKFFEQKSTVKTLSLHQVRQPIYTSSMYKWKRYEKHLGPLLAALKEADFAYAEF